MVNPLKDLQITFTRDISSMCRVFQSRWFGKYRMAESTCDGVLFWLELLLFFKKGNITDFSFVRFAQSNCDPSLLNVVILKISFCSVWKTQNCSCTLNYYGWLVFWRWANFIKFQLCIENPVKHLKCHILQI